MVVDDGNDFRTWRTPPDDALALAVARGIKATDQVVCGLWSWTIVTVDPWKRRLARSRSHSRPAYAYLPDLHAGYSRITTVRDTPVFIVRRTEGEHDYTGQMTLRRQEYWTMLSGATGQFYGKGCT